MNTEVLIKNKGTKDLIVYNIDIEDDPFGPLFILRSKEDETISVDRDTGIKIYERLTHEN